VPSALAEIQHLKDLCTEGTPGNFRTVLKMEMSGE
jgi:hypothetical protein